MDSEFSLEGVLHKGEVKEFPTSGIKAKVQRLGVLLRPRFRDLGLRSKVCAHGGGDEDPYQQV